MIAFNCLLSVFALLTPPLLRAAADVNHSLTVLMDFEAPHSEASFQSLRVSLNQLLKPGGMNVDVQIQSELPAGAQFGELVVFKMKGSCSVSSMALGPIYDERGPLAMAYISDGQVLHFGEVECDRIRQVLQRILGRDASLKSQKTYGSALAVVIAHEVYHMLGNVRAHTEKGLTKPALTASELMDSKLMMPSVALSMIGKSLHGVSPLGPRGNLEP